MDSISIHRVVDVEIKQIRNTGKTKWRSIIVTDDNGNKTDITLFGNETRELILRNE